MTISTEPVSSGSDVNPVTLIEVNHVTKTFESPDGTPLPVLEDISLDLR